MTMIDRSSKTIYSVSDLTHKIKSLLEESLPMVWVCGEISNFRIPSSGHAYFSLKDEKSQISTVMFRGQRRHLRFELEDGISIVGLGRLSVYEPRGTYQIVLEYAEPAGVGALQIAFEQLKRKLEQEGLFGPEHKQSTPFLPDAVCVITSPTGAVIRDILNVSQRRYPGIPVKIVPVRVQGDLAADEIVHAIEMVNSNKAADLIIVARGGGSLEDLQPFNSEKVARAIFCSEIPIVSAVGHETDYTIADFVSDLRAPTPSAAAELAIPVKSELQSRCAQLRHGCFDAIFTLIQQSRTELSHLSRLMVHPLKKVQDFQLRTDDLTDRLGRAVKMCVRDKKFVAENLHSNILRYNPIVYIDKNKSKIDILDYKLSKCISKIINEYKGRVANRQATLEALSPHRVLERGYSITRTLPPDAMVVTDAGMATAGKQLEIILANGRLDVTVNVAHDK